MAKKGTKYKCDECGVVMIVEDPCECDACDVICCDVPMTEVKEAKPKKSKLNADLNF